jgi:hypothetical protein
MQRWEMTLNICLLVAILVLAYLVAVVGSRPDEPIPSREGAGDVASTKASTAEPTPEGDTLPDMEPGYEPPPAPGLPPIPGVETTLLPSNESGYNVTVKPTPSPTPKVVALALEITPTPTPRNRYPDLKKTDPFQTMIPKPTPVVTPAPTPRPPPPLQQVVSTLQLVGMLDDTAIFHNRNGEEDFTLTVGGDPYRIAYKTWGFDLFLIRVDDTEKFEVEMKSDKHEEETVVIKIGW